MARVKRDGKGDSRWTAREWGTQVVEGYEDKPMPRELWRKSPLQTADRILCSKNSLDEEEWRRSSCRKFMKSGCLKLQAVGIYGKMFIISHWALSKWHLLPFLLSCCFSYCEFPKLGKDTKAAISPFPVTLSWVFWHSQGFLDPPRLSENLPTSLSLQSLFSSYTRHLWGSFQHSRPMEACQVSLWLLFLNSLTLSLGQV